MHVYFIKPYSLCQTKEFLSSNNNMPGIGLGLGDLPRVDVMALLHI